MTGRPAPLLAVLAFASACGDIETTPVPDRRQDVGLDSAVDAFPGDAAGSDDTTATTPSVALPSDRFMSERRLPGDDWYDYDGPTHVLTPVDETWWLVHDDGPTHAFRITGYYNARGESGHIGLRAISRRADGSWDAPSELVTTGNVKRQRVCVAMDPLREVPCDLDSELILRTDPRPVPAAGFAVTNPALHPRTLRTDWTIARSPGNGLNAAPSADTLGVLASTAAPTPGPNESLLGVPFTDDTGPDGSRHVLQLTGAMRLAHWRLIDADNARIEVRCAPVAASAADQQPLGDAVSTLSLDAVPAWPDSLLIRLCDAPGGVDTGDFRDGRWPDARTFDLFAERVDGTLSLRPAPGALLRDVTPASGRATFPPVEIPRALWDD